MVLWRIVINSAKEWHHFILVLRIIKLFCHLLYFQAIIGNYIWSALLYKLVQTSTIILMFSRKAFDGSFKSYVAEESTSKGSDCFIWLILVDRCFIERILTWLHSICSLLSSFETLAVIIGSISLSWVWLIFFFSSGYWSMLSYVKCTVLKTHDSYQFPERYDFFVSPSLFQEPSF